MIITKHNIIEQLETDNLIVQSYVYSSKHKKYWKITKPITVMLSTNNIITIPNGFYYDMATIPKWLWSIIRPFNDALLATLIHDYLYIHQEEHTLTRKQVDDEFLQWSNLTNKNKFDNYVRWVFTRVFGWLWWKKIV
jgi:hypothetical protein